MVIHADEPDLIVVARLNAPLVVGLGQGETFVSSDITALIPHTQGVVFSRTARSPSSPRRRGDQRPRREPSSSARMITVDWEAEQAQKGGYPHYMLKEIHEQPEALSNALRGRIDADTGLVALGGLGISESSAGRAARGVRRSRAASALLAGTAAKYAIEQLARLPVQVEPASEFRYPRPVVGPETLVLAFSQSGETADTLAAVREARRQGARGGGCGQRGGQRTLAGGRRGRSTCRPGPRSRWPPPRASSPSRLRDAARHAPRRRPGHPRPRRAPAAGRRAAALPGHVAEALKVEPHVAEIAQRHHTARNALYIGRGVNVATALEGALKLKEISYIHAEGYAAGEMKHGPIALIEADMPVVAIATRGPTLPKLVANVQEARVREAPVIAVITAGENPFDDGTARDVIEVPACEELFSPLVAAVPLQLLAYHIAVERGCDVDQPRNLAKSVTVE